MRGKETDASYYLKPGGITVKGGISCDQDDREPQRQITGNCPKRGDVISGLAWN